MLIGRGISKDWLYEYRVPLWNKKYQYFLIADGVSDAKVNFRLKCIVLEDFNVPVLRVMCVEFVAVLIDVCHLVHVGISQIFLGPTKSKKTHEQDFFPEHRQPAFQHTTGTHYVYTYTYRKNIDQPPQQHRPIMWIFVAVCDVRLHFLFNITFFAWQPTAGHQQLTQISAE